MLLWLINLVCGLTTATKSPAHLIYDTDICQSVVYLYLIRYSNMSKRCLSLSHTILTYVKASFISISYNTDIRQSVVYLYLIRYWDMSKRRYLYLILYWYVWKPRLSLSHTILTYLKASFISTSYDTDICRNIVYLYLIRYWHMSKRCLSLSHTEIYPSFDQLPLALVYNNTRTWQEVSNI